MDYQKATEQIILTLRDKRSQMHLSRNLGFSFNQVYRWESGRTLIDWADFQRLAAACKVDLKSILSRHFFYSGQVSNGPQLLRRLIGERRNVEVSSALQVSQHKVHRWLTGKTDLPASAIFAVIDCFHMSLAEVVSSICDITQVPLLAPEYKRRQVERDLDYLRPYIGGVIRCLELKSYRDLKEHSDEFIASLLNLGALEVRDSIAILRNLELIKKSGSHFVPTEVRLDTTGDFQGNQRIKSYWLKRALSLSENLQAPAPDGTIGYKVFTCSDETLKRIMERYLAFYSEVTELVSASESSERIRILGIHIIDPALAP